MSNKLLIKITVIYVIISIKIYGKNTVFNLSLKEVICIMFDN